MSLSKTVRDWQEARCHHCRTMAAGYHKVPICDTCPTPAVPIAVAELEGVLDAARVVLDEAHWDDGNVCYGIHPDVLSNLTDAVIAFDRLGSDA